MRTKTQQLTPAGQSPVLALAHGSAGSTKSPIAGIIPLKCPKCGAQTRDPFRGTTVIHNIFRCAGPSLPNTKITNSGA